jgi:DNA-binding transcriptional LysR family regulator
MPRNLPPLNALRAFEAAGRFESFSRAAEELGVSHSAISKHVRGLELRLGSQLFRDLPRGVALTTEGARYLSVVTPALDAIGEATDAFEEKAAGTVVVSCESVLAIKVVMPRLKRFYEENPGVKIDLDASPRIANMAQYEADIAVRFHVHDNPEPGAVLVSNAPLYPFASADIAAQIGEDPERIAQHNLLRDRWTDPWVDWFKEVGRPDLYTGVDPPKRLRALLAFEAAASGLGILLASSDNTALDENLGRLARLSETGIQQGSYHMMFGDGVLKRKPVRVFRDWLLDETAMFRTSIRSGM